MRGRRGRAWTDLEERTGGPVQGVRADEVFAARDILPPLPPPPGVPEEPGTPPSLDTETAPGGGIDPAALGFLAADSAARAFAMLADALAEGHALRPPVAELTLGEDAVRLAAEGPPAAPPMRERLASAAGRPASGLDDAVRAWHYGGSAALAVHDEEWRPGPEDLARAEVQLAAAWEEGGVPRFRTVNNRWTVQGSGAQLRYGRDGRWWPYGKVRGRWVPAGPADTDPAAALAAVASD